VLTCWIAQFGKEQGGAVSIIAKVPIALGTVTWPDVIREPPLWWFIDASAQRS
jgi:hypothetical protein